MAGESDISVKGIEQRAEDLEVKLAEEAKTAEKPEPDDDRTVPQKKLRGSPGREYVCLR